MVDLTETYWYQLTSWEKDPSELYFAEEQLNKYGDKNFDYYVWKEEKKTKRWAIFTKGERMMKWGKVWV